jgi:sugar/nucleoside kinase (ribokinase family)
VSKLLLDGVTKRTDITEEKVKSALEYGNISGTLCVQKMGGIPALPTRDDIEGFDLC